MTNYDDPDPVYRWMLSLGKKAPADPATQLEVRTLVGFKNSVSFAAERLGLNRELTAKIAAGEPVSAAEAEEAHHAVARIRAEEDAEIAARRGKTG